MKERIVEIDFAKGVLISLMVLFHLNMFASAYVELTDWVYCFHMSGFLLISGYFQRNAGDLKTFGLSVRRILLPYLFFELVYLIGLSLLGSALGSQNHASLSISSLCNRLFLSPAGTYWYLHTLFICITVSYVVSWLKSNYFVSLILTGCILYVLSLYIGGFHWYNAVYFLMGSLLRKMDFQFTKFILPSLWSLLPISFISYYSINLTRAEFSGVGLTFFMLSFIMAIYAYLPKMCKKLIVLLGKNSLSIVLFSPMFTVLTKQYAPLFSFDKSHSLWALASTSIVLSLCLLGGGVICDKMKVSHILVGKNLFSK